MHHEAIMPFLASPPCWHPVQAEHGSGPASSALHHKFEHMQVAVGVGTLAGSSIMLLTAAWGGSLLAGRCDLDENVSPALHLRHQKLAVRV